MNQNKFAQDITLVFKPRGFIYVAGLSIIIGVIGILSRTAFWLSPIAKSLPSQLQYLILIIQTLIDIGYLVGGIYVIKRHNWARLLIVITAVVAIMNWFYGMISTNWLLGVNKLIIMALPPLFIAAIITIYFSRPSVKTYMNLMQ